jgi:hypothetical protein
VEEEPNPNAPTARQSAILRPPSSRHRAERVNLRTQPHGGVNTVAMPWVDFNQDIAAIRAGQCVRDGNRFIVNHREYVMEGGGRLYPTSGEGLIQLGRGAYVALGWYNHVGLTEAAEAELDRNQIVEDERERAREIWTALQEWRRRQT